MRISMSSARVLAMTTALAAGCASAQTPRPAAFDAAQRSAADAVRAFAAAADARDVAGLERALHPQFRVAFTLAGTDAVQTMDRDSYLAGVRGGHLGGSARALAFGDVAVFGALARVRAQLDGQSGRFESDFVLARADGRWVVLHDATLFAPRPR